MVIALSHVLVAISAAILLVLGCAHLVITFLGTRLHPRDADLTKRLIAVSPVITNQTTMWKAWVGFNASHSLGAMLFGSIYGYLALIEPSFLFDSWFFSLIGLAALVSYALLGYAYWFTAPFAGILVALACYIIAYVLHVS